MNKDQKGFLIAMGGIVYCMVAMAVGLHSIFNHDSSLPESLIFWSMVITIPIAVFIRLGDKK